jgi:hypothetical protein
MGMELTGGSLQVYNPILWSKFLHFYGSICLWRFWVAVLKVLVGLVFIYFYVLLHCNLL